MDLGKKVNSVDTWGMHDEVGGGEERGEEMRSRMVVETVSC